MRQFQNATVELGENEGERFVRPPKGGCNGSSHLQIAQVLQSLPRVCRLNPPEISKLRINLSAVYSLFSIDNVKL